MRLLHVRSFSFSEFEAPNIPPYAVASHRWITEEASIKDFSPREKKSRWPLSTNKRPETPGVQKVKGFCKFIDQNFDGIVWLWIDTCCINQESSAELHESINSMFQWYQNAAVCLAYLADVEDSNDMDSFLRSVWFRRGWTLQELLAPPTVIFLTHGWIVIGTTGCGDITLFERVSTETYRFPPLYCLDQAVSGVTGIPIAVVRDYRNSGAVSIEDKFAWMRHRRTKKPEDMAYCLLGLFGVFLPLIYGEGEERATRRLRNAIAQDTQPDRYPDTFPTPIRRSGSTQVTSPPEVSAAGQPGTSGGGQKLGNILYEFTAREADEITVAAGDEVIVLDDRKNHEWWKVRRRKDGESGVVPSSYVEIYGTTPGTSEPVRPQIELATGPNPSLAAGLPAYTGSTLSQRGVTARPSHPPITSLHSQVAQSTEREDSISKRFMGMGSSRTDAPKHTIPGLRSTLEILSKRERHLQNQMDEQDAIARENVSINRAVAKTALRRKRQFEHQLEQNSTQMVTVEREISDMETANIIKMTK